MRKRVFFCFATIQLLIIVGLAGNIFLLKKGVLGQKSSIQIFNNNIESSKSGSLKYFYEPKANTTVMEPLPGFNAKYTINSDTLNERYNYSITKPEETFRIITLGDSFTYGSRANTEDNWTELLENKLNSEIKCDRYNKFEVINLGVQGYDTDYEVERFKKRGQKYNPDLVIWYLDDLERFNEKIYGIYLKKYTSSIKGKNLSPGQKSKIAENFFLEARIEVISRMTSSEILDYQKKSIEKIKDYYNGSILLVIRPSIEQKFKNFIQEIAKKNNFFYLGDTRPYEKDNGTFLNIGDIHPNQHGHEMIAGDIFNYLKKSTIKNCN